MAGRPLPWAAALAAAAALAGCTIDPTELGPDAQAERAQLERDLSADPGDVDAIGDLAWLYGGHARFDEAAEVIEDAVDMSSFTADELEELAGTYDRLAAHAREITKQWPEHAPRGLPEALLAQGDALRARAKHLERRDRSAVRIRAALADGSDATLVDVMVRCENDDMAGSGERGRRLVFSYYADRLVFVRESRTHGDADREYRLAEIGRLDVLRTPVGDLLVTVTPAGWTGDRTAPCLSCRPTTRCGFVGDRATGGLTEIALDEIRAAAFDLVALPPRGGRR